MTAIVILGLLGVVIILAIALLRTRTGTGKEPAAGPSDPLRRDSGGIDPRRLGVGDVVRYAARDWIVRGSLEFDQDGFRWQEHHLDDATMRRWLSVEDDEELEIVLWEAVVAPELTPGPATIEFGGTSYRLDEHGEATYRATGSTGTAATGSVEYYDYVAGDLRLAFERYGSETWEIGTGTLVNERELDIFPASRP